MKNLNDFRYEKKFYIENKSYGEIVWLIKHNPAIFKEIFYERRINNLYLDSISFKNYNNHLDGNSKRLKVRIRWYGELFGLTKNPLLELKIKNNELGRKCRFKLKEFSLDKNFSYKKLQEIFKKSNLPKWLIEKLNFSRPVLLNSYSRKYFISSNKKHCITLDRDITFYRILGNGNFFGEKITNKEGYVLEIKCEYKNFEKTKDITKYFPFRIIAHSKYIQGINLLFK